jgi:uncharacterized membrane protein YdjX (TVP38/TMEM64 family)
MNRNLFIRIALFIIFFYSITFVLSHILQINISDIQQMVSSFGIYAPVIYSVILLLSLIIPFNPISEFLLINVVVLIFPPQIAILFTFIAHSLALCINYYIGKKFGKRILNIIVEEKNFQYVERYLRKLTIRNLFIIRFFLPISSIVGADIVSYIAGYERLPFIKYFIVSIVPWTIMNILYFTTTSYLSEKSIFLYFIPAVVIVGIPILLFIGFKYFKKQ